MGLTVSLYERYAAGVNRSRKKAAIKGDSCRILQRANVMTLGFFFTSLPGLAYRVPEPFQSPES
jgi:hypothetical protein